MVDLRKYARGKPCQIRLPGCSANPEETVLCHWRDSSTGMGQKEPDLLGAWGCASCHSIVDGRSKIDGWHIWEVQKEFMKSILRTQKELIKNNIIKW